VFGVFFHNKFRLLSRWPGKSDSTFDQFSAIVYACIIMHNLLIKNQKGVKMCRDDTNLI